MINQKVVNYFDITLNLLPEKYYPYRKPGNAPLYINARSDHLPRPSLNSYGKQSAKEFPTSPIAKNLIKQPLYIMMPWSPAIFLNSTPITSSPINILWFKDFNPTLSKTVKTNVGQRFLKLIHKYFPWKNSLHKIFNPAKVKVSYSCMPNMIRSHLSTSTIQKSLRAQTKHPKSRATDE